MSVFSSDMDAAVQFCTSLISCSHCETREDVRLCRDCSQLSCPACRASHSCASAGGGGQPAVTSPPPSHSFLSQLCVQLTSIAQSQRRYETVVRLESARRTHSSSGLPGGSSSSRRQRSRLQAAVALNGSTPPQPSQVYSRKTKPAKEDGDSTTGKRSEQATGAAGISAPTLDRSDSFSQESNSHLTGSSLSSSSSSSAASQRPNKETNDINTSLNNNKKSSSTSNWQSYSMRNNNLIKSSKNKKRSNIKRKKKITGIYLYDLKNNSLNGSYDDETLDFRGFRDSEIDSICIQILRRNMILNKSSTETYTSPSAGLEISIKQTNPSEPADPPRTPSSLGRLGVISPVSREEEERANASHLLDRSLVDLGSPEFSSPLLPSFRSKRHLAFDSPQQQLFGANLSPIPEEAEAAETSGGGSRKKIRLLLDGSGLESSVKREREDVLEETGGGGLLTNGGTAGGGGKLELEAGESASESCEERIQTMLNKLIYKEDRRKAEGTSESRGERVCLSTCGLSGRQQTDVARLARLTHSRLTNCFSHETTHLVLDETSIGCTEYLFAIVYRAIIVSYDWVTLCLTERRILSPMGFIPKTEEGPCRCLETDCEPFQGFYFFMGLAPSHPSHLDYAAYHVTKTLCSHGGGKIIQDQEGFLPLVPVESIKPRFYISIEAEISKTTAELCERLEAVAVRHSWISDSVRAYRALPIGDYLYTPSAYSWSQLASRYRLPGELLASQPAAGHS